MRRSSKYRSPDSGNLWISFSDLMSSLMLIFVLILFYAVYQYYDMLEIKTAELLEQTGLLDEQSLQLALTAQELQDKEDTLAALQLTLDEKEQELDDQSVLLAETETALADEKAKLATQEETLATLQTTLEEKETALTDAQTDLDAALEAQQAQQLLLEKQQEQLDKLVGVKGALIEELMRALADSNISGASVDDSGAIVFSSEMMFDKNRASLKDVGKSFLDSFIPSYLKVLMSDEYSPYVSQIIIEGHTDTDGTFLKNMELSQDRANAVLRYILSDEFTGISEAAKLRLQQIVTVNGRAYSDPIYAEDGSVDMAASRRVVIKFRLNDEDMVNEMINILEGTVSEDTETQNN